jgi:predicted nucleotidyltransferase
MAEVKQKLVASLGRHGEAHGRQLAQELEADSGAVSRRLVELEAEGLVRSRQVGRTKLYRLSHDRWLAEVVKRLREFEPAPIAVLPFGSRARGEARPDSDADVVVIMPGEKVEIAVWRGLREVARSVPIAVDLLIYPEPDARRWAGVPGTPVGDAIALNVDSHRVLRAKGVLV